MMRYAPLVLAVALLSSCSTLQLDSDIPPTTQRAMNKLRVGMKEAEVLLLMRRVSVDSGRVYYGGTGAGRLYFQVSSTRQLWLESGGSKSDWRVTAVGAPEPKTKWTRYGGDSITVE